MMGRPVLRSRIEADTVGRIMASNNCRREYVDVSRLAVVGAAVIGPLPWHRIGPAAAVPVVVFVCGVVLRLAAMRTLGRGYSRHVVRRDDHMIVHTGPYRVVRHPTYGWRIRVEERELAALPRYREYALGRPRLLPGVW